jgi:hypothetical protein
MSAFYAFALPAQASKPMNVVHCPQKALASCLIFL